MLGRVAIIFCITVLILPQSVRAEASLEQQFEAAFQRMYEEPSNVDLTLEYARLAIAIKDYEAAIPPLERLLMFNPNLTKLKLKLGEMYYNLKSYDMAKIYFAEVVEASSGQGELAKKAEAFLAKM